MTEKFYIDAHAHIGNDNEFEEYLRLIEGTNIKGVVVFSPVHKIYDRGDMNFQDNDFWREKRKKANEYVLSLVEKGKKEGITIFPYFFVWNDFNSESLDSYLGVKWHRHADEPFYEYNSEKCEKFIDEVEKRNLPIVLEEELHNTLVFIRERAKNVNIIIPHCGALNGGYENLSKNVTWIRRNVYTDTALATNWVIKDYVKENGVNRIMFGSDFPFGYPKEELEMILRMDFSDGKPFNNEIAKERITRLNILKLLNKSEFHL